MPTAALLAGRSASAVAEPRRVFPSGAWLISGRADFWLASAGGGALLVLMGLVLLWRGDRELDMADLLLSELHLGATYDAIVRRRLWRRMPLDVLVMPLVILVATYALAMNDRQILITTAILYLGAWHRGRQSFGIARFYQRGAGGPVSAHHRWLLATAFYAPMIAAVAYYTSTAAAHEGETFHGLSLGPGVLGVLGGVAAASVVAYWGWTIGRTAAIGTDPGHIGLPGAVVHPAERWLVLANALAFGSAYVLGAWTASFVLVLALHHEVQYLYFTYAVARRADMSHGRGPASELRRLAGFAVWPVAGLASWAMCTFSGLDALLPFLTAGLLGHYWLDGRIWTARARRLGPA